MLGTTARAGPGDIGYIDADNNALTADQQSLRLMLDGGGAGNEWSLHVKSARQHTSGYPADGPHSSDLFRYRRLSGDWLDQSSNGNSTRAGYELDRAVYRRRFDNTRVGFGRQPIDWGSGRLWQPLNVFGAFAPTDLDTDFKPGIDAAVLDWYPSAFSSLTAAYVLGPDKGAETGNSGAAFYRRKAGAQAEVSLLAGSVVRDEVIGASLESSWAGVGWRVEGVRYEPTGEGEKSAFWIAGADYQFGNGTAVAAEWYDNSRGAGSETTLASVQADKLVKYGLQQYLGRRLLGATVKRDITPLWQASYTLLVGLLRDTDRHIATSSLHQLSFTYSLGNESDLLLSILLANGKGLNQLGEPQSEFGHLPASLTVRLRFYF